jgi:LacI family transcriptional regulator
MHKVPKVILWFDFVGSYGRGLLRGITKYSYTHDPWLFITDSFFYKKVNSKNPVISLVKKLKADAVITQEFEAIRKIINLDIPIIVAPETLRFIPGVITIVGDNIKIAKMASEYFLQRGFKNFAYCGFSNLFWSVERAQCFTEILNKAGFMTYNYTHLTPLKMIEEKEKLLLIKWLKSLPKPIGIMACDDDCGRYLLEACMIADLKVPDEIAVIGVDNDELLCTISHPHLSSIAIDTENAGYEAAQTLDEVLKGKKSKENQIISQPTHVITRMSSDILAVEDKEVANVIQVIRLNAKKNIQVNQIINSVTISRRTLQERFKKIVGHTIQDEITRVRIDQVKLMLRDTNESLSRISYILDFSAPDHLSRYFHKETGMTLLTYRKKYGKK